MEKEQITLLSSLGLLMEACRGIDVSEEGAGLLLAYYAGGEANKLYMDQTTPDKSGVADPLTRTCTWNHVINSLITRFYCEDLLQEAYESVRHVHRHEREEKVALDIRTAKGIRDSCHVFPNERSQITIFVVFSRCFVPS